MSIIPDREPLHRLIAGPILTAATVGCLVVGLVAASTVYLAPPESSLVGLKAMTDVAPPQSSGDARPIVKQGQPLDAAILGSLRSQGVAAVAVSSPTLERWAGKWAFLGAVLGLSVLTAWSRLATARPAASSARVDDVRVALLALRDEVRRLSELPCNPVAIADGSTVRAAIEAVDAEIDRSRPDLVRCLGMGRLAEFLIAYAIAERTIHRSLSASTDGYDHAAITTLDTAARHLDATLPLLQSPAPAHGMGQGLQDVPALYLKERNSP